MSKNQYYPETKMDSISAQNQPYPSSKYYPYPEPKNTFRLNPLVISSLKNIDIDDLQMAFGKGIQQKREYQRGRSIENAKLLNENSEIKEIKDSIEQAKLNQFRAHQIHQNQIRRVQNLIKDTEMDEEVLKKLEYEKRRAAEEEERKKQDRIRAKYLIQQQMKDKEFLKEEARKEYEKDKIDVENMINKLKEEDLAAKAEAERKKNIQKIYMENAYAEKDARKERQKEEDRLQKERERKYHEDVQKREDELNSKKAAIQFEKDKIFEQLCQQEAQRQAERDYWENVRNELYVEQENHKAKLKELEEKEKKQKQKEDLLASAIEQMKYKERRKKEEQEMEAEFKRKLMQQYAEDEKLEQYNMRRRKQRELDLKQEVERQWQLKLQQYQKQKDQELAELEKAKKKEEEERYLIEKEKERLIKENEYLLKSYYPTGYKRAINSMRPTTAPMKGRNKEGIIYNNIFGNSNPNPPEAYPKYGKIKNFVYDKSIQEVNHNINIDNYPMYNATANNDYDSYPTPEQYQEQIKGTGQLNIAYAGGERPKEVPMRSQMPVFEKDIEDNYILKNKYAMKQMQMANLQGTGYNNSINTLNNTKFNNFSYSSRNNNTLQQRRPLSAFSNKVNINPNGTHAHENYNQYENRYAYRNRVPESTGLF